MKNIPIDPTGLSYSQSFLVENPGKILYISGQVPETAEGNTPASFRAQCLLAWQNLELQLHKAGMDLSNLVKVTIFLSSPDYREENSRIRQEVLKAHSPALTIIIAGIYEQRWLLEIEAIAMA